MSKDKRVKKTPLNSKDIAQVQLDLVGIAKDVNEANGMMKRFIREFGTLSQKGN